MSGSSRPPADGIAPVALVAGREAIDAARRALADLDRHFDAAAPALAILLGVTGRVVVTGLGKSGLVGAKIAGTLSSTGTPALFMHATEALHGEIGSVCPGDAVLALSNSGETDEVCVVAELAIARGVPVIAMTGCGGGSRLATVATTHVHVGVEREGDPHDVVPSASTTATIVMGDALAIALMVARDFGPADFHRCHPAGSLGRRLSTGPVAGG